MKEIWEDITGYEGLYQVSNFGRVKSKDLFINGVRSRSVFGDRFLKQQKLRTGYLSVGF